MEKQTHEISSLHELQRRVPSFVQAINADAELMAGALANPLLALEELGFTIAPKLLPTVIRRIRFSLETFQRLETLADQIHQLAHQQFDIDSPAALNRVLFEELKLPRPEATATAQAAHANDYRDALTESLPYSMAKPKVEPEDPLAVLRDHHPIIEPLLEYRRLEATTPRLATRAGYAAIRSGAVKLPFKQLRLRLQRGPAAK